MGPWVGARASEVTRTFPPHRSGFSLFPVTNDGHSRLRTRRREEINGLPSSGGEEGDSGDWETFPLLVLLCPPPSSRCLEEIFNERRTFLEPVQYNALDERDLAQGRDSTTKFFTALKVAAFKQKIM